MRTKFSLVTVLAILAACGNEESSGSLTPVDGSGDGSGADISGPPDTLSDAGISFDVEGSDGPDAAEPELREGNCSNGIDDDFDGNTDCADSDCEPAEICDQIGETEFNCVDDFDNDGDGDLDCDDSECDLSPVCRTSGGDDGGGSPDAGVETDAGADAGTDAGTEPGPDTGPEPDAGAETDAGGGPCVSQGPVEWQCSDGVDNDCNGAPDCADGICQFIPPCLGSGGGGGGGGGGGFEFQCSDGVDNDADGLIDCADDNCGFIPPCGGRP